MGLIDWAKRKLNERSAGEPTDPWVDAEFDEDDEEEVRAEPTVSLRFRVTVPELAATADAPKRERTVYHVYGQTREEALARLPESLLLDAKVEEAGRVEGGVIQLPADEPKSVIVDGRAVPGTPGPV